MRESGEIPCQLWLQGAPGRTAGGCDYCLTSYYVTQVCAEAGRKKKSAGLQSFALFQPLTLLLLVIPDHPCCPDPDQEPGGMMLQEAWCSGGDRATPWWQLPLYLRFDWLPEGEERESERRRSRGRDVVWLRWEKRKRYSSYHCMCEHILS